MRIIIWASSLVLSLSLTAQSVRQAENWHFGNGISLQFVDGEPQLNLPSAMDAFEGACSLSDTSGTLLFYSNGGGRPPGNGGPGGIDQDYGTIWNRNHEVFYDMGGEEGGGPSALQAALAFPAPGNNPDLYYLFTVEENEFDLGGAITGQPQGRGLSYFLIDRSLNGGLGGVTLADQRVYVPAYEGLDVTPMEGTDGYWVVTHNNDLTAAGRLVILPLTTTGVGAPREISLENGVGGRIKFSPDGNYLYHRGTLYAFDPVAGTVGETLAEYPQLSDNNATFTPDSRFLYGTQPVAGLSNVIVRYNVETGDMLPVAALEEPGQQTLTNGPFQIGPNGKIYFIEARVEPLNITSGLSEIGCVSSGQPTLRRAVVDLTTFLNGGFFPTTPPQFVDAIFQIEPRPDTLRLDTVNVVSCPGDNGEIMARETGLGYRWSNGDTTATTIVAEPGRYCVTITDECGATIDCQEVRLESDANAPEIIGDFLDGCEQVCVVRLNTDATFDSIQVIAGFNIPDGELFPNFEGTFYSDSLVFSKLPPATGNMTPYIDAYVRSACGVQRISLLGLDYAPFPGFTARVEFAEAAGLCTGEELDLRVVTDGEVAIDSIVWEDGSTDNPRTVTAAFMATYSATVFSVCGDSTVVEVSPSVLEFCECDYQIPEVITPNGDGTNDKFGLFTNCPVTGYTLIVFNRWGQPVFRSIDPAERWDGTNDGTPANMDMYLYRMVFRFPEGDGPETADGSFSLIR